MSGAGYAAGAASFGRLFDLRDAPPKIERADGAYDVAQLGDVRLVSHPDADPLFVEQYRRLGAALYQAQLQSGVRSVMVTSALESEGKTVSAVNLALTLSRSFSKRVLLIDADLRRPAVHALLQLPNTVGLGELLARSGGRLPARALSPTLSVMTAGRHDPDPIASLVSDGFQQLLAEAGDRYDWIVVDTPPVVLVPDAGLLAGRLDTTILVVSAATTASPVAAKAVAAIGAARILGVVLNRAQPADIASGYGYSPYGYGREPRRQNRTADRGFISLGTNGR
ncbi:MAG TPA: CpsD/CapB family tyrosine-protein kinase [Vicinamibacterales bacterium]